jgi:serine/threonine protein kinase
MRIQPNERLAVHLHQSQRHDSGSFLVQTQLLRNDGQDISKELHPQSLDNTDEIGLTELNTDTRPEWRHGHDTSEDELPPHFRQTYERGSRVGRGHFGELWIASRLQDQDKDHKSHQHTDSTAESEDNTQPDDGFFVLKRLFTERGESVRLSGLREVHFGLKFRDDQHHVARFVEFFEHGQGELWLVFRYEGRSLQDILYSDSVPVPGQQWKNNGKHHNNRNAHREQHGVLQQVSPFWLYMKQHPVIAKGVLHQLLSACVAMHKDNRVIHRDIKPANILINLHHPLYAHMETASNEHHDTDSNSVVAQPGSQMTTSSLRTHDVSLVVQDASSAVTVATVASSRPLTQLQQLPAPKKSPFVPNVDQYALFALAAPEWVQLEWAESKRLISTWNSNNKRFQHDGHQQQHGQQQHEQHRQIPPPKSLESRLEQWWMQEGVVRICDFGSAIDDATRRSLFGAKGPSIADLTLNFAPPEVLFMDDHEGIQGWAQQRRSHASDQKQQTRRAAQVYQTRPSYDVWSVGMVFLQMLLGTEHVFEVTAHVRGVVGAQLQQVLHEHDDHIIGAALVLHAFADACMFNPHIDNEHNTDTDTDTDADTDAATGGATAEGHNGSSSSSSDVATRHAWQMLQLDLATLYHSSIPRSRNRRNHGHFQAHKLCQTEQGSLSTFAEMLRSRDPIGIGAPDMQALDLLRKMLHWDPDQRISVADALQHPYFVNSNHI